MSRVTTTKCDAPGCERTETRLELDATWFDMDVEVRQGPFPTMVDPRGEVLRAHFHACSPAHLAAAFEASYSAALERHTRRGRFAP